MHTLSEYNAGIMHEYCFRCGKITKPGKKVNRGSSSQNDSRGSMLNRGFSRHTEVRKNEAGLSIAAHQLLDI